MRRRPGLRKDSRVTQTVFALDPLPEPPARTIYLAGPVPRDPAKESWHPSAIEHLRAAGYDEYVVIPRLEPGRPADGNAQIVWEHAALARADAILFWIPRVLWTTPGLTTNLEWGVWHDSGKAVLGAPPEAARMRYLRFYAELAGAPVVDSLGEAARVAVAIATRG